MNPNTLKFIRLMTAPGGIDRSSADLILDTNVAAEIYSLGDLLRVIDEAGLKSALASRKFIYRRHRMKHSLVLAWWLSRANIPACLLGAEHVDLVIEDLSPGSHLLSFCMTTAFVHIIRDLVLGSWQIGPMIDVDHYKIRNNAADDEILKRAKGDNTPVIAWEGYKEDGTCSTEPRSLRNRCLSEGVFVATPEEWLTRNNVDIVDEAQKFIKECDNASWAAQWENVLVPARACVEPRGLAVREFAQPPLCAVPIKRQDGGDRCSLVIRQLRRVPSIDAFDERRARMLAAQLTNDRTLLPGLDLLGEKRSRVPDEGPRLGVVDELLQLHRSDLAELGQGERRYIVHGSHQTHPDPGRPEMQARLAAARSGG